MALIEKRIGIEAADGYLLEAYEWADEGPCKGVVQIVHGMAEHSRRYRHVAEALVRAGYAVVGAEHRGHGQSALDSGTLGDFGPRGFAVVPDDMAAVSHHLRNQHPGKPLLMLAHSMGSFAAQIYLLSHSGLVDGAALSGTSALDMLDVRTSGWTVERANATVPQAQTAADWLSRDPAVPVAYLADPLCGFALTLESLFSIFDAGAPTHEVAQLRRIRSDLPLYLFSGDRDPVNANLAWFDPLVARLRQAGMQNLSVHIYGGARHEVLNETNRAEVIAQLIAWCDRVAG